MTIYIMSSFDLFACIQLCMEGMGFSANVVFQS